MKELVSYEPATGAELWRGEPSDVDAAISAARKAWPLWASKPLGERVEKVRHFANRTRGELEKFAVMIARETGKPLWEARTEVESVINKVDISIKAYADRTSQRRFDGKPGTRSALRHKPHGVLAVLGPYNFPAHLPNGHIIPALIAGNAVVFKPSEKTPLTALATLRIFERALERFGPQAPEGLVQCVIGGAAHGEYLVDSPHIPLVSATGSTRMGGLVAPRVAGRFGRCILELGGNNAMIVAPSADLDMATRAIVFSAVGTAGQRCTTLRRLIVHRSIRDELLSRLKKAYASLRIGDPRQNGTLVGPLIDAAAGERMRAALGSARAEGGVVHGGQQRHAGVPEGGCYMEPALVEMPAQSAIVCEETFAPILYMLAYDTLDEAIALQNSVTQGLSSCIFTLDLREAERFLAAGGSDCGIANVNIGPSGAEIGGAFGGCALHHQIKIR